jgi:hypothetical protein
MSLAQQFQLDSVAEKREEGEDERLLAPVRTQYRVSREAPHLKCSHLVYQAYTTAIQKYKCF